MKIIYGPYADKKTGRKRVSVMKDDGTTTWMTLARFMMQEHLGRMLRPDEHVDHINNDCTDDRLENLQVLSIQENTRKQLALKPAEMYDFICPQCGQEGTTFAHLVRKIQGRQGKTGPFCGSSCSAKYHAAVRGSNGQFLPKAVNGAL